MECVSNNELLYSEEIYRRLEVLELQTTSQTSDTRTTQSSHIEAVVVQPEPTEIKAQSHVDSAEETEEDCPRIPAAWKLRESLVQELTGPYENIRAQTLNHKRFQDAESIRAERPQLSQHIVFPPPTSGCRTLPGRHVVRHYPTIRPTPSILLRPGPNLGSFYQFPFRSDLPPPKTREDELDTRSIGSQFTPSQLPQLRQNVVLEPSPNFVFPTGGIPAPPLSAHSVHLPVIPPSEFIATESESSSLPEPKQSCSNVCCSSGFIVLWLIIAVILVGIVVGIAVVFARRNLNIS